MEVGQTVGVLSRECFFVHDARVLLSLFSLWSAASQKKKNGKRTICTMMVFPRVCFLLIVTTLLGGCVDYSSSFVPPLATAKDLARTTSATTTPLVSWTTSTTALQMTTNTSPPLPETGKPHPMIYFITILLAFLVAFANPRPLMEEEVAGNLMHPRPIESSTQLVSKLEVVPLGGGGFGGLGFGPGFGIPFGGFGFGFGIRNKPPPPTEQEVIEAGKQELQAVKEYERDLAAQIKSMEQQQRTKEAAK